MTRQLYHALPILLIAIFYACSPNGKAQEKARVTPHIVYDKEQFRVPEEDPRMGLVKHDGLPAIPIGLMAYIRYVELANNEDRIDYLLRQCGKNGFIHSLSLRVHWADILHKENGKLHIRPEGIGHLIDKINAKSKNLHGNGLPIFLKFFFEYFPEELCTPGTENGKTYETTMPDREDFYCYRLRGKYIPISTEKAYHTLLEEVMEKVSTWLHNYDPMGTRIPMLAFIGPFMSSNQMRVPNSAAPDDFPPNGSSTLHGIQWTKVEHVRAFEKFARLMGEQKYPGFAHRYWVFNYTYSGRYPLTTLDQKGVADILKASHPYGESGVLFKSESLCVNFNAKNDRFDPALMPRPTIKTQNMKTSPNRNASWRFKMLRDGPRSPYKTIVDSRLSHGWEIYRQFNYKFERKKKQGRGTQTATMYPLDSMIDNTVFTNPHLRKGWQGTLWVEIKKEEAIRSEKLFRLDTGGPLAPWLKTYDNSIREGVLRAVEERPALTNSNSPQH